MLAKARAVIYRLGMVDIPTLEDIQVQAIFRFWLKSKPAFVSVTLATRTSLRTLMLEFPSG
jgi:hypothetical protein